MIDVWVMFAFGLLGLGLERNRVPLAPLILGMILGPKIEEYYRRAMISARGDYMEMASSGISIGLISSLFLFIGIAVLRNYWKKKV